MEDSSEQSIPPPVDAEQLNEFSDENKGQSDVQVMFGLVSFHFKFDHIYIYIYVAKVCSIYIFLSLFNILYSYGTLLNRLLLMDIMHSRSYLMKFISLSYLLIMCTRAFF